MERVRRGLFNPFETGFTDDPYPHWARLRREDPVHHHPLGYWMLTRHHDIVGFVRQPGLGVDPLRADPVLLTKLARRFVDLDDIAFNAQAILNIDPPDHTRLRRLLGTAFTRTATERLRRRVVELVDDCLDRAAGPGRMEVLEDLAYPLSFTVISEILGMPDGDRDQLRRWCETLVGRLEVLTGPRRGDGGARAAVDIVAYMRDVLAWKRRHPGDDLLSSLAAAEVEGQLTESEVVDQLVLLYIAGHETSLNLIGNGTLALLRHRAQMERLQRDAALDARAVEELLRYDAPVQLARRVVHTATVVGGRPIPAGALVVCILASANRDADAWGDDADVVDLARPEVQDHIAFGGGAHYCLGAALARIEGQVAIPRLVRRFPRLELAAEPRWRRRLTLRGLERLDLVLAP